MSLRTLMALSLATVLVPAAALADDGGWYDDRSEDRGGWYDDRGGDGYDVSVDVDGQGAVDPASFQQPLTPYGDWVTVGSYGTVWRPRVAAGWRPYYYGRWEWTTEGWLWVSDEPFGWATYHYGRWAWDRGFGWVWVPGSQWAPAWVSWRYSGDVVGWAPLAPGLSLYVTDFAFVDFWWTFTPTSRFCGYPVYRTAYAPHYARRWWEATRPAPPRPARPGAWGDRDRPRPAGPAWGGPSSRFVEERIGRPIRPSRIVAAPTLGEHRSRPGEISVYRPDARPRPVRGGEAPRVDRGGRGWDAPRPARPAPAPGLERPRQDRGPDLAPPRRQDRGDRGAPGGRGWDTGRAMPQAPARAESPGWSRPEPASRPVPAQTYSAPPRASSAPASPPPSAPSHRGGGSGGRDGDQGSRPAPPSGQHRR